MVLLQSEQMQLGRQAPDFSLYSVDGKSYNLENFANEKALLVMFICNHCPYVRAIEDRLIALRKAYGASDLAMVGVCSNDASKYPDDSRDALRLRWEQKGYGFPYLIDDDQSVAKAYGAVCTPDLFLFDGARKLFYHGRLDDNWQEPSSVIKHDMREAIDAILHNKPLSIHQMPTIGCSIKWK